jgi:hypothetical protein
VNEPNEPAPRPDETKAESLSTADLAGAGARDERTPDERTAEDRSFAAREADEAAAKPPEEPTPQLFADDETRDLRGRWDTVQASFVDEPRAAVKQADELVATAIKRLAETFAAERERLEGQWDRGDDVSTEDLRVVLRRYRAFFSRLLSV